MTKYSDKGRYDDAIKLAENWLNGHPDDNAATFDEQIAITYLMKRQKTPHTITNGFSKPSLTTKRFVSPSEAGPRH